MSSRNRTERMARNSRLSRDFLGPSGRRQTDRDAPRTASTGEPPPKLREPWQDSRFIPIPEGRGCTRDGHIRAWRA